MAALLAGARLLLRQGLRFLPAHGVLPAAVPVRCLSSSTRFLSTAVLDEDPITVEPVLSRGTWRSSKGLALHNIGVQLKKTGRISKQRFLNIFEEVCKDTPSSSQAWFFLQTCGSSMPGVRLEERTMIANTVWKKLQELGVVFNESHYNILLKIYLENEHKFSPTEFLAEMEAAQVQPNQITYERLLAAYCNQGDMQGASTILGFLKNNDLPITEEIFSSLIRGHARSGDMESAKNILSIMKGTGLVPGKETYVALLCAFAEKGDIENIKLTLEGCDENLKDGMCLTVIYSLAKTGHSQFVPDIFKHMKPSAEHKQDVTNLCLNLLTQGYGDIALQVATKCIPVVEEQDFMYQPGSFFIQHCVELNTPIDVLKQYAPELAESKLHLSPLQFALRCALREGKTEMALELIRALKEEELPVRPHYIWPLLALFQKNGDLKGSFRVLQAIQEMDVKLDFETFTFYIAKLFENSESAKSILQEMGFQEEFNKLYMWTLKSGLLTGKLQVVHALLSTDIPLVMDKGFVNVFKKALLRSNNAELMAKITKLLCRDDSSPQEPSHETESVGYFLSRLIGSMSDLEIQDREEHLKQYFHQLKEMEVIPDGKLLKIIPLLESQDVPGLAKEIKKWIPLKEKNVEKSISELEEDLEMRIANGQPFNRIVFSLLNAVFEEKDVDKVMEIISKHGSHFNFDMFMKALIYLLKSDRPNEAKKVKEMIKQKGFTEISSTAKYLQLFKLMSMNGLIEDAINILKEMQEKDVAVDDVSSNTFIYILNSMASKGDVDGVNRLQEHMVMLGLAKPSSRLCSPLVTVHLKRNDIPAAFDAMVDCQKKYGFSVMEDNLLVKLIESGERDLLKKTVDHLCNAKGERLMLHNLLFAFIESEKYEEAQKIAETPGLRAFQKKITWHMERYRKLNMEVALEKSLEITRVLFDIDREEIYYQLLCLYEQNREWAKAIPLWQKMKEEGLILQNKTTKLFTKMFNKNGQNFSSIKEFDPNTNQAESVDADNKSNTVLKMCNEGKVDEAYSLFLEDKGPLSKTAYARLIQGLLESEQLEKASEVEIAAKSHFSDYRMKNVSCNLLLAEQVRRDCLKDATVTLEKLVSDGIMPSRLIVNKLTDAFAMKGDMESLQKVEEITQNGKLAFPKLDKQFFNCKVLAHFVNENSDEAVALIESVCTENKWETHSINYLLSSLMRNQMLEAVEKVSIVVERLANQFSVYYPVTEMFMAYVQADKVEEAKQLLQRCNAIVEQRDMLKTHISRCVRQDVKTKYTNQLVDLLAEADPFYKQFAYTCQMKRYTSSKKLSEAIAVYERMQAEKMEPDEDCMKRLAVLLNEAGEPVPFPEPHVYASENPSHTSSPSEDKL